MKLHLKTTDRGMQIREKEQEFVPNNESILNSVNLREANIRVFCND